MDYIDKEKVILRENKIFNDLLICLICQGIVINPKECSKCQRPFCERCLTRMIKHECAVCKNNTFVNPHIQTKFNLENLEFISSCCNKMISYKEMNKHPQFCNNFLRCENEGCEMYIMSNDYDLHLKECIYKAINCHFCSKRIKLNDKFNHENSCERNFMRNKIRSINILQNNNITSLDIVNNNRSEVINQEDQCYLCSNLFSYKCYKCNKKICLKCTNTITFRRFVDGILEGTSSKDNGSPFAFNILRRKNKVIDVEYISCVIFYFILGWIWDLLILVISLIIIIVFVLPFYLLFCTFYYIVFLPIHYFIWCICLSKRRKCIRC